MKLICKCKDCKHPNKINSFFINDRIELARAKGKEFEIRCSSCQNRYQYHVDDVKAYADKTVQIVTAISLLLTIVLTILLWEIGFIAVASFSIPFIIVLTVKKQQATKINNFNLLYYDSKRDKK